MSPAPRVAVYDPDGNFMAVAPGTYVTRATAAGELTIESSDRARLRPSAVVPLNELSPEAKRRIVVAREKAKAERRRR